MDWSPSSKANSVSSRRFTACDWSRRHSSTVSLTRPRACILRWASRVSSQKPGWAASASNRETAFSFSVRSKTLHYRVNLPAHLRYVLQQFFHDGLNASRRALATAMRYFYRLCRIRSLTSPCQSRLCNENSDPTSPAPSFRRRPESSGAAGRKATE